MAQLLLPAILKSLNSLRGTLPSLDLDMKDGQLLLSSPGNHDPRRLDLGDLVPLQALPDELPRTADGRKYHASTVSRWALYGLRGVKLASVKIGGKRFSKREWLRSFLLESAAH
jgi:hypothetical protein